MAHRAPRQIERVAPRQIERVAYREPDANFQSHHEWDNVDYEELQDYSMPPPPVRRVNPQQQVPQNSGWNEPGFYPRAPMVDRRAPMVDQRIQPSTDYSSYGQQTRPPQQQQQQFRY